MTLTEPRQRRRAAEGWRDFAPWRPVLLAWLVSRAITAVALAIAGSRDAPRVDITRLVMWDGGWFQLIAAHGYGSPPGNGAWSRWPFFPLYPSLVAALHQVGSPYSFAQVLVANAALLIAMAGVWRLARRHVSTTAATYAVWITALFPGAITFTMGYADSLFLAGAVWSFILLEERRPVAAGLAALVATASRPNGFVVVISLVVAVVAAARSDALHRRVDGGRAPVAVTEVRSSAVAAVAAPSVVFLAAWMVVCWYHTGDPLAFINAKSAWVEYTIVEAPGYLPAALHVVMAVVLLVPFVLQIRRQPVAWTVLVALMILPSFALGVVGLARYAVQCFPLSIAAGGWLSQLNPRVGRLAVVAAAASIVVWGVLITRASYVP